MTEDDKKMLSNGFTMNKINRRVRLTLLLSMVMLFALPMIVYANSAEPPSLVILINNPPADLSIVMVSSEGQPEASVRKTAWEGYYVFYSRDMQSDSEYTFRVTTNGESFECSITGTLQTYNNVFTLDISNQELTSGEYPFRSLLLVGIRVILTILIEGFIFRLFMFREKRSWQIFLAVNLITQGALNIWLSSQASLLSSYLIFGLMVGEIFVFAAEMIAFPIFIKEHKKSHILLYAFVANLISLIVGGYIISVLPV